MVILLDNGHASTTPGKRSPDGQFREYQFNREIVTLIMKGLNRIGIKSFNLVPEEDIDIPLATRAGRANRYCAIYGRQNCLFISVHVNASGNGEWKNARGWSIYTSKGETKSDEYAKIFVEEAEKILLPLKQKVRKYNGDKEPDFEAGFAVLTRTLCPAVLTENLFMDNKSDLAFLMSEEGKQLIADIHINAIKRIVEE